MEKLKRLIDAVREVCVAGAAGFVTCNLTRFDKTNRYDVVTRFATPEKAQRFHSALIALRQCGDDVADEKAIEAYAEELWNTPIKLEDFTYRNFRNLVGEIESEKISGEVPFGKGD